MASLDSFCPGLPPRGSEKPTSQYKQHEADHVTDDTLSERDTQGNVEDSVRGKANNESGGIEDETLFISEDESEHEEDRPKKKKVKATDEKAIPRRKPASRTFTNAAIKMATKPQISSSGSDVDPELDSNAQLDYDEENASFKGDKYSYSNGIDENLEPIATIREAFEDLVKRLRSCGSEFNGFLKSLNSRKIRIATMCSGTESPILALNLVAEILLEQGEHFGLDHIFSAEIVAWKQAFINLNFEPGAIFRDITEFFKLGKLSVEEVKSFEATTAYAGKAVVEGRIDMLIAGTCCADFSSLNRHRKSLEEVGESGETFFAMRKYAEVHRPKVIIIENVGNAPWEGGFKNNTVRGTKAAVNKFRFKYGIDTCMSEIHYATRYLKLDTKKYYIPHTRVRGFMVCVDMLPFMDGECPTKKDANQKFVVPDELNRLLDEYVAMVKKLERPASAPVDAFLLDSDDPLFGSSGQEWGARMEKPRKSTAWERCKSGHHNYRRDLALGSQRPLTNGVNEGSYTLMDYFHKGSKGYTERDLDCMDVSHLRNLLRGFDDRHYKRVLDLSQNVFRDTNTSKQGIIGCLTPNGFPFLTTRGGRILGTEALILQGLPVSQLDLSRLTQKDLTNFAGNAMTTTVVSACTLSAILKFHGMFEYSDSSEAVEVPRLCQAGEDALVEKVSSMASYDQLSYPDAVSSAKLTRKLCFCETSRNIKFIRFQECRKCQHTTCLSCGKQPPHQYTPISIEVIKSRKDPVVFEILLKRSLPMKISFTGIDKHMIESLLRDFFNNHSDKIDNNILATNLESVKLALSSEVYFRNIRRGDQWEVEYDSPHARLILSISHKKVQWQLFANVCKEPLGSLSGKYLRRYPIAKMEPPDSASNILEGSWYLWLPKEWEFDATLCMTGPMVKCYENRCGLVDFDEKFVCTNVHVDVLNFDRNIFERDIRGHYQLSQQCGQAFNSLHFKTDVSDADPPLFFFLNHDLGHGNPKEHPFVFTEDQIRPEKLRHRHSIAHVSPSFRQPQALRQQPDEAQLHVTENSPFQEFRFASGDSYPVGEVKHFEEVKIYTGGSWAESQGISLNSRPDNEHVIYRHLPPAPIHFEQSSCGQQQVVFMCEANLARKLSRSWPRNQWMKVDRSKEADFGKEFGWLLERGLVMTGHYEQTKNWISHSTTPIKCSKCAPNLPKLLWCFNKQGKQTPYEEPFEASERERALKTRPAPLIIYYFIDTSGKMTVKIGTDSVTLMHRATAALAADRMIDAAALKSSWRLITDSNSAPKPHFEPFKLTKTHTHHSKTQPQFSGSYTLRKEQLRALAWMETREIPSQNTFVEEEVVEASFPRLGYRLEGRATREVIRPGGVLAFDVAFGKTALILALIEKKISEAKARAVDKMKGVIPLKATLIVVPNHLTEQWHGEVGKFLGDKHLKTLLIKSIAGLKKLTVAHFLAADIIIVGMTLLDSAQYKASLANFAGVVEIDDRATPRAKSAWSRNAVGKAAFNVERLQENPCMFGIELKQEFQQEVEETEKNEVPVPSKRLKGTAYVSKQDGLSSEAASSCGTNPDSVTESKPKNPTEGEPTGTKKRNGILVRVSDGLPEDNRHIVTNKRNRGPTIQVEENKKRESYFNSVKDLKKEWQNYKSPVLEMFCFSRLVIDEFTYFEGFENIFESIQSKNRWILSGTPALGSFTDIKKMAQFLNVHLGVDDYDSMNRDVLNVATKEMTSAEKLCTYSRINSSAWHHRRHELCQAFLDQFVRQDVTDIGGIPCVEKYRLVQQPRVEWALYQELQQRLFTADFQTLRNLRASNSDADEQVKLALEGCNDVREALIGCASYSKWLQSKNGADKSPCEAVVCTRKSQRNDLEANIKMALRQAELLQRNKQGHCPDFIKWKAQIDRTITGIGRDTPEATDAAAHKPMRPRGKVERGIHRHLDQTVSALRKVTTRLSVLADVYTNHFRSLRFFKAVLAGQNAQRSITCNKCKATGLRGQDFTLLTKCGHLICNRKCNLKREGDSCPVCKVWNNAHQNVTGSTLCKPEPPVIFKYGQKLGEIVRLIKRIPEGDKVLLFVQFPNVLEELNCALKQEGIKYSDPNSGDSSKKLSAFQNNITYKRSGSLKGKAAQSPDKVLILNIGDASASGSNLMCANHIIFVSPYYAKGSSSQQLWESTMTQAIGRARRWGQEKQVYAYHFVTTETIDVDIIEHRNSGKMLVSKSGSSGLDSEDIELSRDAWGILTKLANAQRLRGTKTPLSSSIANMLFKSPGYQ